MPLHPLQRGHALAKLVLLKGSMKLKTSRNQKLQTKWQTKTDQSSCDDCFIVDWPQHTVVRERFPFNPLDVTGQQRGCKWLKLNYHNKNVVSVGGPDVPLTDGEWVMYVQSNICGLYRQPALACYYQTCHCETSM